MNYFVLIITFCCITFVQTLEPQYTVDIIDVDWNVTTTNNFEMVCEISRISRGVLALSAIIDFKEDLNTDKAIALLNVYYSRNSITYTLSPYRVPPMTLTEFFNFAYKDYVMHIAKNCCKNPIDFEGIFVPPLTKRQMICTNCFASTKNLPSYMRPGYYKAQVVVKGELGYVWELLVEIEML